MLDLVSCRKFTLSTRHIMYSSFWIQLYKTNKAKCILAQGLILMQVFGFFNIIHQVTTDTFYIVFTNYLDHTNYASLFFYRYGSCIYFLSCAWSSRQCLGMHKYNCMWEWSEIQLYHREFSALLSCSIADSKK